MSFTGGIQTTVELLKKLTEPGPRLARSAQIEREGEQGSVMWVATVVQEGEEPRVARAKMLDQALRALVVLGKAEGWLR